MTVFEVVVHSSGVASFLEEKHRAVQLRNLVGAIVAGRRVELQCCWIKVLRGRGE